MGCNESKIAPVHAVRSGKKEDGTSPLVVPDTHVQNERSLHDNIFLNFNITGSSSVDLVDWVVRSNFTIAKIEGKPKANSGPLFKDFQDLFVESVLGKQEHLPKGYLYWGDDNSFENLPVFLRTNPFMASALSSSINEKGAREFHVQSSTIASESSWYRRIVALLDNSYVLVDAAFDSSMNLNKLRTYKAASEGTTIFEWNKGSPVDSKVQDACAHLLFLLVYHSQMIHTLIHVLHYMLDCAIVGATEHSADQTNWARPYIPNVALKYLEVKKLLFAKDGGDLTGGLYRTDYTKTMALVREMLKIWLHCENADDFVSKFLLKDVLSANFTSKDLTDLKILEQFFAQTNLASGYAFELCAAFEKTQPGSVEKTDEEIKKFFSDTSSTPDELANVRTLNTWIQIYSVTGIIHGSTLSFSRLVCTAPLAALYHPDSSYIEADTLAITTVTGTITGTIQEHHVYSNKMYVRFGGSHKFKSDVSHVLSKYENTTTTIKRQFLADLKTQPDFFKRFGWIVSDYCPDGVDGKQLTLCTYI